MLTPKLQSVHFRFLVVEQQIEVFYSHEPSESDLYRFRATIYLNGISIPVYQEFVSVMLPDAHGARLLILKYQMLPDKTYVGYDSSGTPLFEIKAL